MQITLRCPGCGREYTQDDLKYATLCGMDDCELTETERKQ